MELGGCSSTIRAPKHTRRTGQRRYNASCSDLADRVVDLICYVDVPDGIDGYAGGKLEPRVGTGCICAAGHPGRAGERRHDARRSDLADRTIAPVGHIDIP